MKILFVTPPPYLPNRLHRNRSFDLIRILAKKHEVHLFSLTTDKKIPKEFSQVKKVCKSVKVIYISPLMAILNCFRFPFLPYEVAYCYSEKVKHEIQKIIKKENIEIVYLKRLRSAIYNTNICHAEFISATRNKFGILKQVQNDPKWASSLAILDATDAMSMFYFRMYQAHSFPKNLFYLWQAALYKRLEKSTMKKLKNWIVCSEIDKKYLDKLGGNVNINVVPNPVDANYFSPPRSRFRNTSGTRNSLLFRGLMDKPVNIDAALFFIRSIFPIVKKKIKSVKLYIVGPKPPSVIRKYNDDKNIFVTGFVEDIRKYIRETDLSICPVKIASGTRFKILHAWAMGRPVVSTTLGAEGLSHIKNKNIAIADRPKEFAKQIISLLKNKRRYDTLAKNGRETVIKYYSFKVISQKLETIIQNVTSPKRH